MRIAVAQFSATMSKPANLDRIADLTARAADAGARLVVFPEGAMCDFGTKTDDLQGVAEPLDGQFVQSLSKLADRFDLAFVAGMFESIPGDHLIHNSAIVVAPSEGLVGVYRKHHLFDAFGEIESERFRAGDDDPLLIEIEGFKVGVVICYDMRFASFIERAADGGADLIAAPAAWVAGPLKEEHLSVIAHARAIDNTVYVAVGGNGPPAYTGRSVIVDPLGVTLAGLGEADGVATADVSRDRLKAARARLPVLRQRRGRVQPAGVSDYDDPAAKARRS
jgi:deaminated glutathione amidase